MLLTVFLNINGTHQRKGCNNGYVVHFYYEIDLILKYYGVIGKIVDSFQVTLIFLESVLASTLIVTDKAHSDKSYL